jgi:regulator of protease activity HflC (stomatin/prohibitin superfamily)
MSLFRKRRKPSGSHASLPTLTRTTTSTEDTPFAAAETYKPLSEYKDITMTKSTRGPKIGTALAGLALLGGFSFIAASSVSTGPNEVALHIGGGPIEDATIKKCVPASTHENFNSPGDEYIRYSTSQRDWDATGQGGSDMGAYHVVSKDNVEMQIPIIVRFYQITDCETLTAFYNNLGQRYNASINEDGSGSEGWQIMIRKIVADPVDVELGRIAQEYDWTVIRNDPKVRTLIADTLRQEITGLVDSNAQGHYFENFSVLVKKPEPTDPELIKEINGAQAAKYEAEAAKLTAEATRLQAIAEQRTAKAQSSKKIAEILGFRLPGMSPEQAVRAYNEHMLIESGGNPFQPQYLVGGTAPVPSGSVPPPAPAPVQ